MSKKDPRVDAYIAKSAAFAKPILSHLRKPIHDTCRAVEETINWSFPHFEYKAAGERRARVLCGMPAFKQHCAFGVWYRSGAALVADAEPTEGIGQYGKIKSLADLPKDKGLVKQIKDAMKVHDAGIKPAPRPKTEREELQIPNYLAGALEKNKKAQSTFEGFNYS